MAATDLVMLEEIEEIPAYKKPTQDDLVALVGHALMRLPLALRKEAAFRAVQYIDGKVKTHLLGLLLGGHDHFVNILLSLPLELQKTAAGKCMNFVNRTNRTHLLGLPAKLRNAISSYAVVEEKPINVFPWSTPRHPLMQTCRGMYGPVGGIYYSENEFNMVALDYQGARFEYWLHDMRLWQGERGTPENVRIIIHGTPHWKNLLEWLQAYHSGKVYGPAGTTPGLPHSGVYALFRAVDAGPHYLPWTHANAVLTEMRPFLALQDQRWNIDY